MIHFSLLFQRHALSPDADATLRYDCHRIHYTLTNTRVPAGDAVDALLYAARGTCRRSRRGVVAPLCDIRA